jgi:hypothetical protein
MAVIVAAFSSTLEGVLDVLAPEENTVGDESTDLLFRTCQLGELAEIYSRISSLIKAYSSIGHKERPSEGAGKGR